MQSAPKTLELFQPLLAVVACLYFLVSSFKKFEIRQHNATPFILCLVVILIVLLAEVVIVVVRSRRVLDVQPMATALIYIFTTLLQLHHLIPPPSSPMKAEIPAWHALLGSWAITAAGELLAITKFAVISPFALNELICTAIRLGLLVVMFILFAKPDNRGYIRLDNEATCGDVAPETHSTVDDEIRKAGGYWPWLKGFTIFLPYIWPPDMPRTMGLCGVTSLLLMLCETGLRVYNPYLYSAFVSGVTKAFEDHDLSLVWSSIIKLKAAAFISTVISALRGLMWEYFQEYREKLAKESIFNHIMEHDAAFHDTASQTDITTAIDLGTSVLKGLDFVVTDILPHIIELVSACIAIFSSYGPHVMLLQLFSTSIYTLLFYRNSPVVRSLLDETRNAENATERQRQRALRGWWTAAVTGQIQHEIATFSNNLSQQQALAWSWDKYYAGFRLVLGVASTLGETTTLTLVVYFVYSIGSNVGAVVSYTRLASMMDSSLRFLANVPDNLIKLGFTADRLRRLLKQPRTKNYGTEDLRQASGGIEFIGVSFNYKGQNKPIFKDFSFSFESGKSYAVIGPSGLGKSTIYKLAMGFYNVTGGCIKINGQNISTLSKEALSRHFAVMPQNPRLLSGTVEENIRYGNFGASNEEVKEAAEAAGIHDIIMKRPEQYNTPVGESGGNFSGGETQRILLACAFLQPKKVLVMDEGTSALDADNEAHVLNSIKKRSKDKIIIQIAHRMSTVRSADVIVVLGSGENDCCRVVEQGTHDELIERDGTYARTWRKAIGASDGKKSDTSVEELFNAETQEPRG